MMIGAPGEMSQRLPRDEVTPGAPGFWRWMVTFGDRLKSLRKDARKSQSAVTAEIKRRYPAASISQTYLSALEQRRSAPREKILTVLADYYNVPIHYFFEPARDGSRRNFGRAKEYVRELRKQ